MNKNSPLNQRYICPIGADGIQEHHIQIVNRVGNHLDLKSRVLKLAPLCFGKTAIAQNPALVAHWTDRWSNIPARAVYYEAFSWLGREDLSERIADINVPTLIVHGEQDAVIPIEEPTAALNALPDARLVVRPKAGHTSNLENPDAFNRAVRAFLDEIYDT